MDRATTIAQHPEMASVIQSDPRPPDASHPPSAPARFWELNRIMGGLARAGLAMIFLGALLALVVYLLVHALS